jgi:SPP1 family predicted phage head-tail adaptor
MAVMINPGDLRTQLSLEQMTPVPDGAGGFGESWTGIATFFAKLEPVAARDKFGADQTLEEVTHRVTIRHRPDVASGMRLAWATRRFLILTVHDPDETGRYLVLRTREDGR